MSISRPVEVKQDIMESRKLAAIIPIECDSGEEVQRFAWRHTLDEMVLKFIGELEAINNCYNFTVPKIISGKISFKKQGGKFSTFQH